MTDQASGSALVLLNDADWTSPIPPPGPILLMQDEHHANTELRLGLKSRDDTWHGVDFVVVNALDELITSPRRRVCRQRCYIRERRWATSILHLATRKLKICFQATL